jgi:hypothetical protein
MAHPKQDTKAAQEVFIACATMCQTSAHSPKSVLVFLTIPEVLPLHSLSETPSYTTHA